MTLLSGQKLRFVAFALVCAVLLWIGVARTQNPAIAVVRVVEGQGEIVRRDGTTTAAANGRELFAGDIVRTGAAGKVSILFNDGSEVRLNVSTEVELLNGTLNARGARLLLRVRLGQIWSQVRPGWAIETPSAIALPRGTTDLLVRQDRTVRLSTIEGETDFYNQFGTVLVSEFQQSEARPGAAPTKPITLNNPGLIIEWTQDLSRAAIPRGKLFVIRTLNDWKNLPDETQRRSRQVVLDPVNAEARRNLGDALFDASRYAEALKEYESANRIEPGQPATLVRIGYALLELNRLKEAEIAFQGVQGQNTLYTSQAQVGRAWIYLSQNQAEEALRQADTALGREPNNAEGRLVRGIALLRLGQAKQAQREFQLALDSDPKVYQYQAQSWLGLAYLQQGENARALEAAKTAVQLAPGSSLAQGNLAQVYFFTDRPVEAEQAARLAVQANPNSVAAQVVLGQAALARGDVGSAVQAGTRATVLDPQSTEAHYLLGVAEAARRNYGGAARALRKSVKLAPDFLPASAALARVYNRMGQTGQAIAVITDMQQRRPKNAALLAAMGETYYDQAKYAEATKAYEQSLEIQPSALVYASLARVALDANRLNQAINAGQKAVQLAYQVGQYHSILGLAYLRSGLSVQAEREFREALALDPNNALAITQLSGVNRDSDQRLAGRTSSVTFAQGFLYDPMVARDFLRGGIHTQLEGLYGSKTDGVNLEHRSTGVDGKLNFYGRLNRDKDEGDRVNSDSRRYTGRQDTTLSIGNNTNLYFHLLGREDKSGVPGTLTAPAADDRDVFKFRQGMLAMRQQVDKRSHLWAGVFFNNQRDTRSNPNLDTSFNDVFGDVFKFTAVVNADVRRSATVEPEVRYDVATGIGTTRRGTLSLGYAHPKINANRDQFLEQPGVGVPFTVATRSDIRGHLGYVNWSQRVGKRFSYSAQVRALHEEQNSLVTTTNPLLPPTTVTFNRSTFLPSGLANWQVGQKTLLRLYANRRTTDTVLSVFAPNETLLTSEGQIFPSGLPLPFTGDLKVAEVDLEHYLSTRSLVKMFAFRTSGSNLTYDFSGFVNPHGATVGTITGGALNIGGVDRVGAGARFERQFGQGLFGHLNLVVNRSTSDAPGTVFDNQTAPYHPKVLAGAGLNYVGQSGTKVGVTLNYTGSFFQDTSTTGAARPRFPAKTTVDLLLSREPSVRTEVFLGVRNLLNTRKIVFNDVPLGGRRLFVGATKRF